MAQNNCICGSFPSSKFSVSESSDSERGKAHRKRLLRARDREQHHFQHQVSDLCESLSEGNQTMLENVHLMSHIQDNSMTQCDEIYKLKKDLDHSRELLHQCSCAKMTRFLSGTCSYCQQQAAINLERERVARERSDAEKFQMVDLLNMSLSHPRHNPHVDSQLQSLSSDINSLKTELLEAQMGVNKTEATTANMEFRVTDIEKKILNEKASNGVSEKHLNDLSEEIKSIQEDLLQREATLTQQRLLEELKGLESQVRNEREAHLDSLAEVERLSKQVKKLTQKLQRALEEKRKASCKCVELENELALFRENVQAECDDVSFLKHENTELKVKSHTSKKDFKLLMDKYQQLESQSVKLQASNESDRHLMSKYKEDLSRLQSDKEVLMLQNSSLQQDLSELTSKACVLREQTGAERAQHKESIERLKFHYSTLAKKFQELTFLCKSLKTDLSSAQNELVQLKNMKSKTEEELQVSEQSFLLSQQELNKKMESIKMAHRRELSNLVLEHNKLLTDLRQKNSKLQMQLSDEQSAVRALRVQHCKALEDQQRLVEEDLSRSLKDSERVKLKYVKAKKYFQDKVIRLQMKLDTSKHEEHNRVSHHLLLSQGAVAQLTEEQNVMLKALSYEIDTLVDKLSTRVDMPESLAMPPGIGSGTKTLFAELLTKTQWLKKEITELVAQEDTLQALRTNII